MKTSRGFTLVELLVVISIISLLASVVLASLNSARDKGRVAAGKQFFGNVYHATADQAVGLWDFEECSGTTPSDRSGNGNNGSFIGTPAYFAGSPYGTGCSLQLNGTARYVNVPNSTSLAFDVSQSVTAMAWVKTSTSQADYAGIIAKATATNPWTGWQLVVVGNKVAAQISDGASCTFIAGVSGTTSLIDGGWHAVALVVDRAATSLRLYVDGREEYKTVNACIATIAMTNSVPLYIGAERTPGIFFNGLIDSAYVFTKALTAIEINKLYAAEKPKFEVASR